MHLVDGRPSLDDKYDRGIATITKRDARELIVWAHSTRVRMLPFRRCTGTSNEPIAASRVTGDEHVRRVLARHWALAQRPRSVGCRVPPTSKTRYGAAPQRSPIERIDHVMPSTLRWAGGAWLLLLAAYASVSSSESWGVVLLTFASLGATLAWGALLTTHRLWRLLFWSIPVGATVLFIPLAVAEARDEFASDVSDFTFLIIASLMIVAILIAAGAASAATLRRFRMSAHREEFPADAKHSALGLRSLAASARRVRLDRWRLVGGFLRLGDCSRDRLSRLYRGLGGTHHHPQAMAGADLVEPLGATVLTVAITTSFMRDESGVDSFYPQWIFVVSLVEIAVLTAAGAGSGAIWRLIRTRLGARHHHPSMAEPTLAKERDAT